MLQKSDSKAVQLIKKLLLLKKKVHIYEERLQKIDDHRTEVEQDIYFLVREEYENKLSNFKQKVDELVEVVAQNEDILKRAKKLKDDQKVQLERKFQEFKLRHYANEITDETFNQMEERYNAAVENVNLDLNHLDDIMAATGRKAASASAGDTVFAVFSEISGDKKGSTEKSGKSEGHFTRMQKLQDIFGEDEMDALQINKGTVSLPLLYFDSGSRAGEIVCIKNERVTVGRVADNDIQIERDTSVSRYHAEITHTDGNFYLKDLNSSNGTLLNNKLITGRVKLNDSDIIGVGESNIRFVNNPMDKRIAGYEVNPSPF